MRTLEFKTYKAFLAWLYLLRGEKIRNMRLKTKTKIKILEDGRLYTTPLECLNAMEEL